jgi:hypothetical protein
MQGEKTNISNVELGSLLSIRSRDKNPADLSLPAVSQRSPILAPASSSRIKIDPVRLKTVPSCMSERKSAQNSSRCKIPTLSDTMESTSGIFERNNQVEKLRKEFVERNTLHFTKLREAFRTIDKDHNGCMNFLPIRSSYPALFDSDSPQELWTRTNCIRQCNSWAASM